MNETNMNQVEEDIKNWIKHISTPVDALGGFSVCPYAKGAEYSVVVTDGSDINPPPWDFELLIYVIPEFWSENDLVSLAKEYNKIYTDLVFLPDHRNKNTFIKGIQTNNGKHNLLLCQWRDSLNQARDKLSKTLYYSFWDNDYLKEILGT